MKFFLVRFEPQLSQPVRSLSLDCIYIIAHSTADCNRQSATSIAAGFVQVVYVNRQLAQIAADQFVQLAIFVQVAQFRDQDTENLCIKCLLTNVQRCGIMEFQAATSHRGPPTHFYEADFWVRRAEKFQLPFLWCALPPTHGCEPETQFLPLSAKLPQWGSAQR